MVDPARALVEKQVGRVRLRLFLQVGAESLAVGLTAGLVASMLWFLAAPFASAELGDWVSWIVPAALLALSTLAGLTLAWIRRPSLVTSSLALDARFGLKERVTTFLTLPANQIDTLVGQALLKDVTAQLTKVKTAGAFPVRISWQHLLMPTGAFVLAGVAFFLGPLLAGLDFSTALNADESRAAADQKKLQDGLEKLKKNVVERTRETPLTADDIKKMEDKLDELLKQPLDGKNPEKIKERLNEFRKLQDKMKERLDGLKEKTEKIDALKKQLEKLGLDKDKLAKDGPAKDFQDALTKGDLKQAQAALEKLVKDLKNDKLSPEQQKQLAEQFKKLQEQLKKVMNEDDFLKKLKQDLKDGKINKEDLAREMENFQHLQDLAKMLGDTEAAMGKADSKERGEALDKLMKRFEEFELTEAEIRELLRDQDEVAEALRLLEEAQGDGDGEGGGNPGGRRNADPNDPNSKIRDERSRGKVDPKASQRMKGFAPGGTFSKIPAQAVDGAFKQAAQDSPEALDRQRIPDDAAAITREYFKKLGNQK